MSFVSSYQGGYVANVVVCPYSYCITSPSGIAGRVAPSRPFANSHAVVFMASGPDPRFVTSYPSPLCAACIPLLYAYCFRDSRTGDEVYPSGLHWAALEVTLREKRTQPQYFGTGGGCIELDGILVRNTVAWATTTTRLNLLKDGPFEDGSISPSTPWARNILSSRRPIRRPPPQHLLATPAHTGTRRCRGPSLSISLISVSVSVTQRLQ